jgi:hypothetical protein
MSWASPEARLVRGQVFSRFAAEGRPPSVAELEELTGLDRGPVLAALAELHEAHALVLTRAGDAIRMAHPFSAWPMGFVVRSGDRFWWGGCAWDSLGIVAALGERLTILTACPHCGRELSYAAGPRNPPDAADVVVRVPRPAAQWWDDVVATCTAIRAFCSGEHLEAGIARTGEALGASVELERLWELALPWYGDRLDSDWAPQSRRHRQDLLERSGLRGPFWELPGE